jgi:hypothetical protein
MVNQAKIITSNFKFHTIPKNRNVKGWFEVAWDFVNNLHGNGQPKL